MTHPVSDTQASGLMRQAAMLGALAALLMTSWRSVSRTHRARNDHRSKPLPERLQNWEGEGGRPDPQPTLAGSGLATSDTGAGAPPDPHP